MGRGTDPIPTRGHHRHTEDMDAVIRSTALSEALAFVTIPVVIVAVLAAAALFTGAAGRLALFYEDARFRIHNRGSVPERIR